jgi:hypothetical protein
MYNVNCKPKKAKSEINHFFKNLIKIEESCVTVVTLYVVVFKKMQNARRSVLIKYIVF